MAQIPTGYACPTCDAMKVTAMLFAQQFATKGYFCMNGHQFEDLGDLLAMNPRKIPVPQKQTLQENHEKVEMSIPSEMKAQLLTKFGTPERLASTLSGVLRALASPRCFIVSEEDIEHIVKILGVEVKSARELVGIIFERNEAIKALRQAPAEVPANGKPNGHALPDGTIAVDLSSHIDKLKSLAKFRNESPQQVAEGALKAALDGGWA